MNKKEAKEELKRIIKSIKIANYGNPQKLTKRKFKELIETLQNEGHNVSENTSSTSIQKITMKYDPLIKVTREKIVRLHLSTEAEIEITIDPITHQVIGMVSGIPDDESCHIIELEKEEENIISAAYSFLWKKEEPRKKVNINQK